MKKTLAIIFVSTLVTSSLALAGGLSFGRSAAGTPSVAAYQSGARPQDGTGSKVRRGQPQNGNGQGSGDRVRKGDGSCGEQGAQQTRKGNRSGAGKGQRPNGGQQ